MRTVKKPLLQAAFLSLSVGAILMLAECGFAQPTPSSAPVKITNNPPAHYNIKPSDLPPPKIQNDVVNPPTVIPAPADATLNVPAAFILTTFAEGGFTRPRWMALAPNGDVFLADSQGSKIFILRDTDKDGVADERSIFLDNMKQPFGIAFWRDYVYIRTS